MAFLFCHKQRYFRYITLFRVLPRKFLSFFIHSLSQLVSITKGNHFAVFDFHVHLRDFGDAQITYRTGSRFDRPPPGFLLRLVAHTDDVDDAIDTLRRLFLGH